MLVKLLATNFKSYESVEFSMIPTKRLREKSEHKIKDGQTSILKNAVIFGPNASGKSNFIQIFDFIKNTLVSGLAIKSTRCFCRTKTENSNKESFFELHFVRDKKYYIYGFTALLSQRKILKEWLEILLSNGEKQNLFLREGCNSPILGKSLKLGSADKTRFKIYADDFKGNENRLFLSEISRNKKFEQGSKLTFIQNVFYWLTKNIVILNPYRGFLTKNLYYNQESLDQIALLMQKFDTGISEIFTKKITKEELSKKIPQQIVEDIFNDINEEMQQKSGETANPITCRVANYVFNIKFSANEEPVITVLVIKHKNSFFEFDYMDESDGTQRMFDLIDLLLTVKDDTVYIIDELERSLHPLLTYRFIETFLDKYKDFTTQLIFSTHENYIMTQHLFRPDEIWLASRNDNSVSSICSLGNRKIRYDKIIGKAYLAGEYDAVPKILMGTTQSID